MASLAFFDQHGEERIKLDAAPAHYVVKIQPFSSLSKSSVHRHTSRAFHAGGYTWRLVLYPTGNPSKNVKGHVSLYLAMAETSSLPLGWQVHASVRFFLLAQDKDSYLVIHDSMREECRFHRRKLEHGIDQFIPLETLNDAQNGYLVDDTCVLGAEVIVTRGRTGKGEILSMVKDVVVRKRPWKINNFCESNKEFHESNVFVAGNQKWKIRLYPAGKETGLGSFISLYLVLADEDTLPPGTQVLVDLSLSILDQLEGTNITREANRWFSASSRESGWPRFISHDSFYSDYTGTLVEDTCWVAVKVGVLGMLNAL